MQKICFECRGDAYNKGFNLTQLSNSEKDIPRLKRKRKNLLIRQRMIKCKSKGANLCRDHEGTGLDGKGMLDHSYFKEKLQAELLDMLSFFFFFFVNQVVLLKSDCLMEQMVEVLDSGTFIVMLLNAKHQEWISQAMNLI